MKAGLSPRELAHILAALRYCQDRGIELSAMEHFQGETFKALTPEGVDRLCEWLNDHGMVRDRLAPALPDAREPTGTITIALPWSIEGKRDAKLLLRAEDLVSAWHQFLEQVMRPMIKWPPDTESEDVRKRTQEIFDKAWETVRDYDIADLISD
jgi:hypothetical protein